MSILAAIGAGFVTVAFVCAVVLIIEFVDELRQEAGWLAAKFSPQSTATVHPIDCVGSA